MHQLLLHPLHISNVLYQNKRLHMPVRANQRGGCHLKISLPSAEVMIYDILGHPVADNGMLKIVAPIDIVKTDVPDFILPEPFPEGPVHPGNLFAVIDKKEP